VDPGTGAISTLDGEQRSPIEALVDTGIAIAQDRIRLVSLSIIAGARGFLPSCLSSRLPPCSHSDVVWRRVAQ
jgi:hypothetical protein